MYSPAWVNVCVKLLPTESTPEFHASVWPPWAVAVWPLPSQRQVTVSPLSIVITALLEAEGEDRDGFVVRAGATGAEHEQAPNDCRRGHADQLRTERCHRSKMYAPWPREVLSRSL